MRPKGTTTLFAAAALSCALGGGVWAEEPSRDDDKPSDETRLEELEVRAQRPMSAASSREMNARDFTIRPHSTLIQILNNVPGLVVAQHQGGSKAPQWFLRGFDADHGTDVAVFADEMPINMRHACPRPGLRRSELPDPRDHRARRALQGTLLPAVRRLRHRRRAQIDHQGDVQGELRPRRGRLVRHAALRPGRIAENRQPRRRSSPVRHTTPTARSSIRSTSPSTTAWRASRSTRPRIEAHRDRAGLRRRLGRVGTDSRRRRWPAAPSTALRLCRPDRGRPHGSHRT